MDYELTEKQKKKLERRLTFEDNANLAILEELEDLNENIEELKSKEPITIEFPTIPDPLQNISVDNFPDVQKVEVLNFPYQKAPVVNVKPPEVNVDVPAPVINIEKTEVVFPDVQKTEVVNPQKEVMLVDEEGKPISLKELGQQIGKHIKVVGGGGGGGNGLAIESTLRDQLQDYFTQAGPLVSSGYLYIGKVSKNGAWYIKRMNTTTKVWGYTKGSSDFDTSWTNKASLTYQNFDIIF